MSKKTASKFSVYSTNDRKPMHFSGANGFPVGCYDTLLNGLSQNFSISSVWHKGVCPDAGKPPSNLSWDDYADDLISHLKKNYKEPVVGVGHSMGAIITLIAAAKQPKLFSQLILIEPVILSKLQTLGCQYAPDAILHGLEPVKSALVKPTQWANKEKAFQSFKKQTAFKRIEESQLHIMQEAMTEESNNKLALTYPLNWEVANYLAGRHVLGDYQKLKVPTAIIRGKPSIFAHDKTWQKMMRLKPKALYINEMSYGHLMPFEAPQVTRQLIMMAIKKMTPKN